MFEKSLELLGLYLSPGMWESATVEGEVDHLLKKISCTDCRLNEREYCVFEALCEGVVETLGMNITRSNDNEDKKIMRQQLGEFIEFMGFFFGEKLVLSKSAQ